MEIIEITSGSTIKHLTMHLWTADHADIPSEFERKYGYAPERAYQLNGVVFVPVGDGEGEE